MTKKKVKYGFAPDESPKKTKKPARPKYRSRATRLNDAIGVMRDQLSTAESMIPDDVSDDELEAMTEEQKAEHEAEREKVLGGINDILTSLDVSPIEDLRQEIDDWKCNIEEKFSNTDKYSRLEECESCLSDGVNNLEGISEASDFEDARSVIDEANGYLDDLENADFPGMFG